MSALQFNQILQKYRTQSYSERDKGNRFERLMQAFLQTYPMYRNKLEHVWLWNEFPFKESLGGSDLGIDIVARTYEGEYWAVQCKCYVADAVIDKPAVDSFLTTSARSFSDNQGNECRFSFRLWIDTTEKGFNTNAVESIQNQEIPFSRLGLIELMNAEINWLELENGIVGTKALTNKKQIREHQQKAIDKAHEYFKTNDRGKLIMACGTGKTFTSLKIAEKETDGKGTILFLVPSIALLGQTLREWNYDAEEKINAICICSDSEVSQVRRAKDDDTDGFSVTELAMPASTSSSEIHKQFNLIRKSKEEGMTVFFSTYQSIDKVAEAQHKIGEDAVFDLIICDEAHRTTGVTLKDDVESKFVSVHDNDFIKAKKRLYMTATPRIYAENAQIKAREQDAVLCSMDDVAIYGNDIYRIGFGEAVEQHLLSDYKVLVLTLGDTQISPSLQRAIAGQDSEIKMDDATKLIGCINALSKKTLLDSKFLNETDPEPMRRAVAFCQTVKISKQISSEFNSCKDAYYDILNEKEREEIVNVEAKHVDGTMGAALRDMRLQWLKDTPATENKCRILTNVRCLSEGVDVPSLDAVLFLSARNSQVDVVQSVGRVMRRAEGKKYGYIIIPVIVPSDIKPEEALNDNERFKVVWTVLNALRAHDDRFNATINKIELNKKKPSNILVGGVSFGNGDQGDTEIMERNKELGTQLSLRFEELQSVIYARMVQKVGDKRYWEQWAADVAKIAERHIKRIKSLISTDEKARKTFDTFLKGLHRNINPSVDEDTAVEMLAQHLITQPVFEALFDNYSFAQNNPMSKSLGKMISLLNETIDEEDTQSLERFYKSVRQRAEGIDNAEAKQKIIIELYDKFFKTAFPRVVEMLGIVYTPVECVDFILHSVEKVLNKEFGRSISDENVNVIDPFTGTGTFVTRLLQSGIIKLEDMERKFKREITANEIVLLAYYIASINIENAYHDIIQTEEYTPFNGICLTDTFQLGEQMYYKEALKKGGEIGDDSFAPDFPENSARIKKQLNTPITVIIGNPPYSVGQKSANDNAQNQSYPRLEKQIEEKYVKNSEAALSKAVYDSYIKAFRWATDRLRKEGGIIGFISNGAWLESNGLDGFRKSLQDEFTSIYVFNLRGNQRTSGELSRKEGGKIFGSGSRTPIAITILVKKQEQTDKAKIYYHDIGDYLSREEKLRIIAKFGNIFELSMEELHPNEHGDWINQRNDIFSTFIPIEPEKKFTMNAKTWFNTYAIGVATNRDAWVYGFSKQKVSHNMRSMIDFYNQQREKLSKGEIEELSLDTTKISWTRALRKDCTKNIFLAYDDSQFFEGLYRPFNKQTLYYHKPFIESPGLWGHLFPKPNHKNLVICVSGVGANKPFTALITDSLVSLDIVEKSQCFPFYWYEKNENNTPSLFDDDKEEYTRHDAITDFILKQARSLYGGKVNKEDIFYYVYGFLHSPEYREIFAADLKKMLPRIPLVESAADFWTFSNAGRELAKLHLNYEHAEPYAGVEIEYAKNTPSYYVEKMRFLKKEDKTVIQYNPQIRISNIPLEAYEYVVNGKSAIEWIMERYAVTTDKASGIVNNPNDWATEHNDPQYIFNLLLRIITVSIETMKIVKTLPHLNFSDNSTTATSATDKPQNETTSQSVTVGEKKPRPQTTKVVSEQMSFEERYPYLVELENNPNASEANKQFVLKKRKLVELYPEYREPEPIPVLNLIMRREFAEEIVSGTKKLEFRDFSDFYCGKLLDKTNYDLQVTLPDDLKEACEIVRQVKSIHFHNYNNSWELDVECLSTFYFEISQTGLKYIQDFYNCHDYDEDAEYYSEVGGRPPLLFAMAVGKILKRKNI